MRVSAAFPSPYLKASDLQGRRIPVKILRVEMQELGDELKPVVYFEGKAKGLSRFHLASQRMPTVIPFSR